MSQHDSDSDACSRAAKAAREVLLEECGPESFQIDMGLKPDGREMMMGRMGLFDDNNPDCDARLEEGYTEKNCTEFPFVQQLVFCTVWNEPPSDEYDSPLIDVFGGDVGAATEEAWKLHGRECGRR